MAQKYCRKTPIYFTVLSSNILYGAGSGRGKFQNHLVRDEEGGFYELYGYHLASDIHFYHLIRAGEREYVRFEPWARFYLLDDEWVKVDLEQVFQLNPQHTLLYHCVDVKTQDCQDLDDIRREIHEEVDEMEKEEEEMSGPPMGAE